MAISQTTLTPTADQTPAVVNVSTKELSGAQWVARYPTSTSIGDLLPDFAAKVTQFLAAITAAGGTYTIAATYRPDERAFLMHYSSLVATKGVAPENVPAYPSGTLDIEWVHDKPKESISAAANMAAGYGIAYPPAYPSRHSDKTAIDMHISGVIGKSVNDSSGKAVKIDHEKDLYPVGASYGVKKLVSDPPHWSSDGH